MLTQILNQSIISTLSSVYANLNTDILQNGSIDIHLDVNTKIHIHGMKQIQKGKTYILVQVIQINGDFTKSRTFYIDQTDPDSVKPKLKFLLSKKGW